jgi:hypothetical protein
MTSSKRWFTTAGSLAALVTAAGVAYWYATDLFGHVTANRWQLLGAAGGAAFVVGLLAMCLHFLLKLFRREPSADADSGLAGILAAVIAVSGVLVAVHLVPRLMADPMARKLAAQKETQDQLTRPLLPEVQRAKVPHLIAAELERLLRVGKEWEQVLFDNPDAMVPLLRQHGMVPHTALVAARLSDHGWKAAPLVGGKWVFAGEKEEIERLIELRGAVVAQAKRLKARLETEGDNMELLRPWIKAYEDQARAIELTELQPVVPPDPAIAALAQLALDLSHARRHDLTLKAEDWNKKTKAWTAAMAAARDEALPLWQTAGDLIPPALAAARSDKDAELVSQLLIALAEHVDAYDCLAKRGDWWLGAAAKSTWFTWGIQPGLKQNFAQLRTTLAQGHKDATQHTALKAGRVKLQQALDKALASDRVPTDLPKRPPANVGAGEHWSADEIWTTIAGWYDFDAWGGASITLGGQKVPLVKAIKNHFDSDFRAGSPPQVHPGKFSRAGALKRASAIVVHYVKHFAREIAAEWAQRNKEVRAAKPANDNQVYPNGDRIRALLAEDAHWRGRFKELKSLLAETLFSHQHVATRNSAAIARRNVAVEEVTRMVDDFVQHFELLGDPNSDPPDAKLTVARAWYDIFTAGGQGPGFNPAAVLLKARQGVPEQPLDANGKIPRKPDGKVDWTKVDPKQPRIATLKHVGGPEFDKVLTATEPLPEDRVPAMATVQETPDRPAPNPPTGKKE